MKRCPKCNRTYADDGFTFCLEDGALLSAPYDPGETKPAGANRSSEPPPTAVMPRTTDPQLPPTISSPPPLVGSPETKRTTPLIFEESLAPRKSSLPRYLVVSLITVFVLVIGWLIFVAGAGTSCPQLVISCVPDDARTLCELEERDPQSSSNLNRPISDALSSLGPVFGLQSAAAPLPKSVTGATWSSSAGTIETNGMRMVVVNNGLAGQRIKVEAKIHSTVWLCSKTVSTSFVVPTATSPTR